MKFKEIDVVIGDETYQVREGTLEETLPLLGMFSDPDQNRLTTQLELLKLVVHKDGQRVGEGVGKFPQSTFLELMPAALKVCGMGGDE